jgi:uncharacterized spore protein YtfJ
MAPPSRLTTMVRWMHDRRTPLEEMAMDLQNVLVGAQEALTVHRVFGDPITLGDTTLVPAAVIGGGGGGGASGAQGGAGFGMQGRPCGVFVVRNGEVSWKPAVDVNRIVLGGQFVAIAALLFAASLMTRYLARA